MTNQIGKINVICSVINREMLAEISLNIPGLLTERFLSRGSKAESCDWLASPLHVNNLNLLCSVISLKKCILRQFVVLRR